jgi:hypothetical protein
MPSQQASTLMSIGKITALVATPSPSTSTSSTATPTPPCTDWVPTDRRASIFTDCGASILRHRIDIQAHAASSVGQKIVHKVQTWRGRRTPFDKMNDFIDGVVLTPGPGCSRTKDPVDPSYERFGKTVGKKEAALSVGRDEQGQVRVHAFERTLNASPAIRDMLERLRNDGWNFRYGTANSFSPGMVTLDPRDPAAAIQALWQGMKNHAWPEGDAPAAVVVEKGIEYLYDHRVRLTDNHLKVDRGDGFYNLASRAVQHRPSSTFKCKYVEGEAPGVDLHDASMVFVERAVHRDLNARLRSFAERNEPLPPELAALDREIKKSLAKFPPYEGRTYRGMSLTHDQFSRYQVAPGTTITEAGYTHGSKSRWKSYWAQSNTRIKLDSVTGRQIGKLSPHDEVIFESGTDFTLDKHKLEASLEHDITLRLDMSQSTATARKGSAGVAASGGAEGQFDQ